MKTNATTRLLPLACTRFPSLITLVIGGFLLGELGSIPCHADILYVGTQNQRIEKFTSNGVGTFFAYTGPFFSPGGLAFDSLGNLYAGGEIAPNGIIAKFAPSGAISVFASNFNLSNPQGLAFDNTGNLYVANSSGNIMKFTPGGVSSVFLNGGGVKGLAFDSAGNLFAAVVTGTILKITPGGVSSLFAFGATPAGVNLPSGLAFDSLGNLYVANEGNYSILKFTPGGVGSVFANTGLSLPVGLAFDSAGYLYAANRGNGNIVKFNTSGTPSVFVGVGSALPKYMAFTNDFGLPLPLANTRGFSPAFPVLPTIGTGTFLNAQSGLWFDPPLTSGYDFEMMGSSLFTQILGFPAGVDGDNQFDVWVGASMVGTFGVGQSVDFVSLLGGGVASFRISGIDPQVDSGDPQAFQCNSPLVMERRISL